MVTIVPGLRNCATREQRALDFQVLGYDFDDPVRLRAQLQVVLKISGDDAILESTGEKRCGPRLDRGGQPRPNDAIPDCRAGERQAPLLLVRRKLRRSDIQ